MVFQRGTQCAPLATGAQKKPDLDRVNGFPEELGTDRKHTYRHCLEDEDRMMMVTGRVRNYTRRKR